MMLTTVLWIMWKFVDLRRNKGLDPVDKAVDSVDIVNNDVDKNMQHRGGAALTVGKFDVGDINCG